MLLAVHLSSKAEGLHQQAAQSNAAMQAVAVVLQHVSDVLPIAAGSAEVFKETCRGEWTSPNSLVAARNEPFGVCGSDGSVCNVPVASTSTPDERIRPKFAWYRPIGKGKYRNAVSSPDTRGNSGMGTGQVLPQTSFDPSTFDSGSGDLFDEMFNFDNHLFTMASHGMADNQGTSNNLPGGQGLTETDDLAWLLLGSSNIAGGLHNTYFDV